MQRLYIIKANKFKQIMYKILTENVSYCMDSYRFLYYDVSRNIKSLFVEQFEAFSRNALFCNNSQFPYHVFSNNVKGNNIKQIQITSIQIP